MSFSFKTSVKALWSDHTVLGTNSSCQGSRNSRRTLGIAEGGIASASTERMIRSWAFASTHSFSPVADDPKIVPFPTFGKHLLKSLIDFLIQILVQTTGMLSHKQTSSGMNIPFAQTVTRAPATN